MSSTDHFQQSKLLGQEDQRRNLNLDLSEEKGPLKEIDMNVVGSTLDSHNSLPQVKAQKFELSLPNLKMTSLTGDSKIKEANTIDYTLHEHGDSHESQLTLKLVKKSNSSSSNYDKEN